MLNFFKRQPKITFACKIDVVAEKYPPIPASEYKRDWFKNSVFAFKERSKHFGKIERVVGSSKCPGIIGAINTGFIFRSWFDFSIETLYNNNIEFRSHIPDTINSFSTENNFDRQLIKSFSATDPIITVPTKENSIKSLIKVETPWVVHIPKGWALLVIPVSYSDDTRFTSTQGILYSGNQINPILEWHVKGGLELVKAGTPLCQMVPIKIDTIGMEIAEYNEHFRKMDSRIFYDVAHKFIKSNKLYNKK